MKHIVVRDCYGFRGRFWKKGQVVDVQAGEKPPKHIVPEGEAPKAKAKSQAEIVQGVGGSPTLAPEQAKAKGVPVEVGPAAGPAPAASEQPGGKRGKSEK